MLLVISAIAAASVITVNTDAPYRNDDITAPAAITVIVMAELPTGQISYHYEEEYWNLFSIPERPVSGEYDGHDSHDVVARLTAYIKGERNADNGN